MSGSSPRSFHETIPARPWMRGVGVFMLLAAAFLAVVIVNSGPSFFRDQVYPAVASLVAAVLLVAAGILMIVNRITLEVDTQRVAFAYWPIWKEQILRADIADLSTAELNPVKFGGLGLRRGPGRTWGLLFSGGPALVVTRKSDGATFSIRTDHADEAIAAFQSTSRA